MSMKALVETAFKSGHVFHDPTSNFTLNFAGFGGIAPSFEELVKDKFYAYSIKNANSLIERIEKGEIVNHSVVKEQSEDRAVDHYNLRFDKKRHFFRFMLFAWKLTIIFLFF